MARLPTLIFGVILVLLGLLGFISNPLIGAHALFAADAAHNVVHILLGVLLLTVAFWAKESSALWLKGVGILLFLFGLAGVISVPETGGALFGAFMTNRFSDWFHLVAGAIVFFGSFHDKDDPHTSASGMKF
ncbi:TPA: hypothetical protein DIV48_00655 [Candidatus Kaiserbacteria bacterium]|nr:MAG: TonB-dependent siderophore receptor [Parcubacteria group bacterium GW2011_GWA1_56_13]KKW45779.1 MAG: TonB-dependent siderophore receptor [Parcubacteria group bacterium GW2011_GWB1_57_6]HCR52142.1 hypothetical protein [Candidatus Kaiserbacteria bacterium]